MSLPAFHSKKKSVVIDVVEEEVEEGRIVIYSNI